MPSDREISKLNKTLGERLGWNKFGEPLYKWAWSEDLTHAMVLNGKFNHVEKPIFDDAGKPTGQHLIVMEPVTQVRKMCWWLERQWVLTRWVFEPQEVWDNEFKGALEWPRRGYYHACDGAALQPGEVPDVAITDDVIQAIAKQREKTVDDFVNESERALEVIASRDDSKMDGIISESMTAFGNPNPGSRAGGISTASPDFKKNYDKALGEPLGTTVQH